MKYDKFFALAKEMGIEDAELYIAQSYSLGFSLFHGEVENYQTDNGFSIQARGIYKGKFGTAVADVWNNEKCEYLVKEIIANASVIENTDPVFIFEGSPKYKKVNTFNKELSNISIDEKMNKLYELEKKIFAYDKRITEVESVSYEESAGTTILMNSKGLKLMQKNNYFIYYGGAVAKQDEQVKSNGEIFLDNDFSKFDVDELANKIGENLISQLGGEACDTGVYQTVLAPNVLKSLINFYISSADAEQIQKKSSLFIGKLNQKVASKKVTIEDRPLDKTLFAKGFDDEGVATSNRAIIKNGNLETYLYNLTTAAKDGVETTGNAARGGSKIGVSPTYLVMKPGKKTEEELFAQVENGVYITEVQGLHSGLNAQTGNFSLQSKGYLIKDGKKDRALDLITTSGNLMTMFQEIIEVGNNVKVFPSAVSCPSVIVKKLNIGGK